MTVVLRALKLFNLYRTVPFRSQAAHTSVCRSIAAS